MVLKKLDLGVGDMSQLVECLTEMHDFPALIPSTVKANGSIYCNLSTQDVEAGG